MNEDEMQRRAEATVKAAGLSGEHGLAVHEGFATARAGSVDGALGDVIPGVSALLGGSRRIVLVTDGNVYVFQGRRFDRPGTRLGSYPVGPAVISFDGAKLSFPDGQIVFVTAYQAAELTRAAGVDADRSVAEELVKRAGLTGEVGVAVEHGQSASETDKLGTAVERTIGMLADGEITRKGLTTHVGEGRVVLVTDKSVRVYRGDRVATTGELLATFELDETALRCEGSAVTFPNGEVVEFSHPARAQRLVAAVQASG
jgi:hypothetical protein